MNALAVKDKVLESELAAVELYNPESAITERDEIVSQAASILIIQDDFTLTVAVELCAELKTLTKSVEETRGVIKAPVLELGRRIDNIAKGFAAPCEVQYTRLNRLIAPYQAEQRRLAEEAEQRRQEELRRIERERIKAEQAEAKRAADLVKAEADAAKAKAEAETAFDSTQAADAVKLAQEAEATKQRLQAESEQSARTQAALDAQRRAVAIPVKAHVPVGLTTRETWQFEVTDIAKVYAANPGLCRLEINRQAVNDAIRSGHHEIPGLRIWQETRTGVRV